MKTKRVQCLNALGKKIRLILPIKEKLSTNYTLEHIKVVLIHLKSRLSYDKIIFFFFSFPTKRIKHKPGDESLEIVYDIRTFIENWNWGTVNMISNDIFWTDNFTNKDLQAIKK